MNIQPITLTGQIVRLEPLQESHLPDLIKIGLDEDIWRFMLYGEMHTEAQLRAWVLDMLNRQAQGNDLPFAVIHLGVGAAVGATRYMNINRKDYCVEIGGTWYGQAYQGSGVNAEAKYLLLKHAFEDLRCIRVQFKTDARNLKSQRAIERLGAAKEGVFRKHMILPDGTIRDSVFYSIIDSEWPAVKRRLEQRLREIQELRTPQ